MGQFTISMVIFNSYLDITRGYPNHLSHAKTIKNVPTRAGEEQPGRWGTRICPFGAAAARTRPYRARGRPAGAWEDEKPQFLDEKKNWTVWFIITYPCLIMIYHVYIDLS